MFCYKLTVVTSTETLNPKPDKAMRRGELDARRVKLIPDSLPSFTTLGLLTHFALLRYEARYGKVRRDEFDSS